MQKLGRILRKIFTIAFTLSAAALFVVVLTSAIKKKQALVCSNVQVHVDYNSGLAFLDTNEIKDKINSYCGGQVIGKLISAINFHRLEKEIEKNPYIADAEVYTNQQQNILVSIKQKRPILRVINNDGVSYYISEKNERIPLSTIFTVHVPVALGDVVTHQDIKRDSTVQAALFNFIQFVRRDSFLEAMIDQVVVNENGDFDLYPRAGGHVIHFGQPQEEMTEKFDRLKIFYKEGLTRVGWDKYQAIDLQFDGQVVCEKKGTIQSI